MLIPLQTLVVLYLAFAAKQFVCDFLLQTTWMAKGKCRHESWLPPLLAHAATHAAGTLLIVLLAAPALFWLAIVDFGLHAGIDRVKARATTRMAMNEPRFWWALGADQMAHQLTHFGYVLLVVTHVPA
ncbi:hypothetical protein Sa4125_44590 [Aureimonas sp. SA4125]|uniref:DUF3307 domain-containing protein n=1 Tax=Aureimonas sp. SA4125 TaxID=2826993 RepID=UPI001CC5E5B3|nr:DUF3307 domain-containing protein [Aureimonas sp. SA4125]BDA86917.1 hypothetical protein Sa4125_44590 [Aureimonas sp. SA4125]